METIHLNELYFKLKRGNFGLNLKGRPILPKQLTHFRKTKEINK
jgi:hypothetical protein